MELLVVIAIIGVLAAVIIVATAGARGRARDVRRKTELVQIGRFLTASSCYTPNAGTGDYDLADLVDELRAKYPQFSSFVSQIPRDPKSGSDLSTNYHYLVSANGSKCALYANLENPNEPVTISSVSSPTPGAGTGVLQALTDGWNGSNRYFQVSN